jgi:hypothetical protein
MTATATAAGGNIALLRSASQAQPRFETRPQEVPRKPRIAEVVAEDCRTCAANGMEKVDIVDATDDPVIPPMREDPAQITVRGDGIALSWTSPAAMTRSPTAHTCRSTSPATTDDVPRAGPFGIGRRAQGRNRTADTGIFSPLLYRLSYLRQAPCRAGPPVGARGEGGAESLAGRIALSRHLPAKCGQERENPRATGRARHA